MKLSYKKRIFFSFLAIFSVFAIFIIIIEQSEEKKYRTEALEIQLESYAELIHSHINIEGSTDSLRLPLSHLVDIMPKDLRVTVLKNDGEVIFDKEVANVETMDNHLDRPEVVQAKYNKSGSHIRLSSSTNHEYLYYAKSYDDGFVRVALPYDVETKNLLKADNWFIYIVGVLFVLVLILLNYAAGRFSQSISKLKYYTTQIKNDGVITTDPDFPDDELGEIGKELIDIFNEKERSKQQLLVEKEKLIRHFRFSEEGICIFKPDFKQAYFNAHFIQFLNLIIDKPFPNVDAMFDEEVFKQIKSFVNDKKRERNHLTYQLSCNGKTFVVKTIIYEDDSFEVKLRDITQAEKTRLIKQEMTNNIAHELRTPVTSLRGYLETLKDTSLTKEKQELFIDRAYIQSLRLSNLIEDVSLLSKIEERESRFTKEPISLKQLIDEVRIDLTDKLTANEMRLMVDVPEELIVNGNHTLLYSVFRNLVDNSISYAGVKTEIHINNYMLDGKFAYFSYYDTGKGVEERHLNRLFERFYRVGEGRTRDTGGSGLGLSIVRNAIMLHGGKIEAKNRLEGGLEFLFTIKI